MAWNKPSEDGRAGSPCPPRRGGTPRPTVAAIVGVIVVLGAAIAAWWLWPNGENARETPPPQTKQLIKEVAPAAAPKAVEVAPKPKDPHEGLVRASNGVWFPKDRPFRFNWTRPHGVVTNDFATRTASDSAARNGTEAILEGIFSLERGDMPLPLPPELPEDDFKNMANILISREQVTDEDSEQLKMSKELLNQVKAEIVKYIKDGGEIEDFITYYHEELERCFIKRQDSQAYLYEMVEKDEDPELIKDMTKKLNEKLEKEGIKPLDDPIEIIENTRNANEETNN